MLLTGGTHSSPSASTSATCRDDPRLLTRDGRRDQVIHFRAEAAVLVAGISWVKHRGHWMVIHGKFMESQGSWNSWNAKNRNFFHAKILEKTMMFYCKVWWNLGVFLQILPGPIQEGIQTTLIIHDSILIKNGNIDRLKYTIIIVTENKQQ